MYLFWNGHVKNMLDIFHIFHAVLSQLLSSGEFSFHEKCFYLIGKCKTKENQNKESIIGAEFYEPSYFAVYKWNLKAFCSLIWFTLEICVFRNYVIKRAWNIINFRLFELIQNHYNCRVMLWSDIQSVIIYFNGNVCKFMFFIHSQILCWVCTRNIFQ